MVRRGILVLFLAAGLFGGSTAAGFLLAKGAFRHVPGAAATGSPDASRSAVAPPAPAVRGGGVTAGPVTRTPPTGGAATPPPASPAPGVQTAAGASSIGGPAEPAAATPMPAPSAPSPVPTAPAPAPRPSQTVPVLPGRFHVQVAGFPELQNAQALALRLRARGYAVTVTDGPPYRVWVGGYLDRATAERLATYLRQSGLSPTLVPQ
jgi:cell division septation protein DedD